MTVTFWEDFLHNLAHMHACIYVTYVMHVCIYVKYKGFGPPPCIRPPGRGNPVFAWLPFDGFWRMQRSACHYLAQVHTSERLIVWPWFFGRNVVPLGRLRILCTYVSVSQISRGLFILPYPSAHGKEVAWYWLPLACTLQGNAGR